jgi:hypothetical protein
MRSILISLLLLALAGPALSFEDSHDACRPRTTAESSSDKSDSIEPYLPCFGGTIQWAPGLARQARFEVPPPVEVVHPV